MHSNQCASLRKWRTKDRNPIGSKISLTYEAELHCILGDVGKQNDSSQPLTVQQTQQVWGNG